MIIGITGKSGSGKTFVANLFESKYSFKVIHGDEIAHDVLDIDLYNEVLGWFNLKKEENVNRKRLGQLLFNNKELMKRYNEVIYERIKLRIDDEIKFTDKCVIEWNFLPISDVFNLCDKKILLIASDDVRKRRVIKRDDIDESYFMMREREGLTYNETDYDYVLTSDKILNNDGVLEGIIYGN